MSAKLSARFKASGSDDTNQPPPFKARAWRILTGDQARLVSGLPAIVMSRISSLVFDRNELLKRATIITPLGSIKVEWRKVGGDRHWISSGDLAARLLAVPVIQRIERMVPLP